MTWARTLLMLVFVFTDDIPMTSPTVIDACETVLPGQPPGSDENRLKHYTS